MTYEFTQDWLGPRAEWWQPVLQPYIGTPARMLEVGSFEGRSATWFLDNILTHPDARIVCVDTFGGSPEHRGLDLTDLESRFDRNMARHAGRFTKLKGSSHAILRTLEPASFDIAYIDGSHEAADVLMDAVLVWDLLKPGSIMMFDDYGTRWEGFDGLRTAIDAFLACMEGRYELIRKQYQVILRRTE
jgi:hypothetical protein